MPRPAILALLPQLAIIAGAIATIIYGIFFSTAPLDFRMLNCAWATWSIWTLSGICQAALFKMRWAEEAPEPEWFSRGQIIHNVLAFSFLLFMVLLSAAIIVETR